MLTNGNGYDAYLFDLDGVLLDFSDDLSGYTTTVERAFTENGVNPNPKDTAAFASYDDLEVERLRSICEDYGVSLDDVWRTRERLASEFQIRQIDEGKRSPYEDILELRGFVRSRPSGVVSNNQHTTVEYTIESLGLGFDTFYGREPTVAGIERGKPSPHYVNRALEDLEGTKDAVLIGDSESDVRTARRAGIDSALIVRSHTPEPSSLETEPTHVLKDLRNVPEL